MLIKEITVSVGVPIEVAPYVIIKPFISLTAELDDNDRIDVDSCVALLHEEASKMYAKIAMKELEYVRILRGTDYPAVEKSIYKLAKTLAE
jgi:hypothetical protein